MPTVAFYSGLDSVVEREEGEGVEDICKIWSKQWLVVSWLSGRGLEGLRGREDSGQEPGGARELQEPSPWELLVRELEGWDDAVRERAAEFYEFSAGAVSGDDGG